MDKNFFIDGNFVVLYFLEAILKRENQNKTIKELLEEKQLLGKEQYLLNPSLLIGCLYGTFLIYQQQIENETNQAEIEKCLRENFKIIKHEDGMPLSVKIRNALAHYHVELEKGEDTWNLIFKDKYREKTEFHFIAEISLLGLRTVIKKISEII